ncbi:hypothetical protein PGQ11_014910 [Apiospora arundinis]|uniref:CCHC-type domain-containing protein n=1 Tax=Apiospora arundinis TaxID=335852 RepID=A0ABR2HKG0_9PEZI
MVFKGSPKQFRHPRAKILYAWSNIDHNIKQQYRLKKSFGTKSEAKLLQKDWKTFEKWTRSVIRRAANEEAIVSAQLENARQRPGQTPVLFHQYLASLEAQTDRRTDKQQALAFFGKLLEPLREEIISHCDKLPDRRNDIVDLASRRWEILPKSAKEGNRTRRHAETPTKRQRDDRATEDNGRDLKRRENNRTQGTTRKAEKGTYTGVQRGQAGAPDLSQVTCYRCHKKGHYAKQCPEPESSQRNTGKGKES